MQTDMRLIDANKLVRDLTAMQKEYDAIAIDGMLRGIASAPTIEAEPVRHGRWVRMDDTFTRWKCSECGAIEDHGSYAYCHCGARMDGDK